MNIDFAWENADSATSFLVTLVNSEDTPVFSDRNLLLSGNNAYSVMPYDREGDGDLDILYSILINQKVGWFVNDGNGNFQNQSIASGFSGACSARAGDFDGDGDLDVVDAAYYVGDVVWWENDGDSNYSSHVLATSLSGAYRIRIIDLDRDNDLDILCAARGAGKLVWWENDGSASFTQHDIGDFASANSIDAADLDGDDDLDIIASAMDPSNEIAWWKNDGAQSFTKQSLESDLPGAFFVFPADMDDDGDTDILGAVNDIGLIVLYENDGVGTFTKTVLDGDFLGAHCVRAEDLDLDGDLDAYAASYSGSQVSLTWYDNEGTTYTRHAIESSVAGARDVASGDFNGDGRPDMVAAFQGSNSFYWYQNELPEQHFVTFSQSLSNPEIFADLTPFYWWVSAFNPAGISVGPVWDFTTAVSLPDPPVAISPADGTTSLTLLPVLSASTFFDLGQDAHAASQWQVREAAAPVDYSVTAVDSGRTTLALTQYQVAPGDLGFYTGYLWRVRYQDEDENWGGWSAEVAFRTDRPTAEMVVFDLGGDIWIMDGHGGEPTALTAGPSRDSDPRFNRSGSRIAFSSNRDGQYKVWLVRPDGSDLWGVPGFQSANPICVGWSPDDKTLVVAGQGDAFYTLPVSGATATPLVQHVLTQAFSVDWSDQNRIALGMSPLGNPAITSIRTILPNGADEAEILNPGASPDWNGDGAELLFVRLGDIWRSNSLGAGAVNLTASAAITEGAATWSAEGDRIYYQAVSQSQPDTSYIYAAQSDGSSAVSIFFSGKTIGGLDAAIVTLGSNLPPVQPLNMQPAEGAADLIVLPTFSASDFSDPDGGDTHAASRWQIRLANSSYENAAADETSGDQLASFVPAIGKLVPGQAYYWRVRYIDSRGNASPWSTETSFSTLAPPEPKDRVLIVAGGGTTPAMLSPIRHDPWLDMPTAFLSTVRSRSSTSAFSAPSRASMPMATAATMWTFRPPGPTSSGFCNRTPCGSMAERN
ncbi:VCBS repeat-containing protein [bacterium]|nr:VCBS repeat-containing protein [bacterium]